MEEMIQLPADFKYRKVFLAGRPKHDRFDSFSLKHPPMPASRWAKIYAPFAALKGFDDCIRSAEEIRVERKELSAWEKAQIDSTLRMLAEEVPNSRVARERPVFVSIRYFAPYGEGMTGEYRTIEGQLCKIGIGTLNVDGKVILLENIVSINPIGEREAV